MTGTDAVAKAEPDGHTIGISIGGPLAINTLLFAKMPYDPAKDIALITHADHPAERARGDRRARRQQRRRTGRAAEEGPGKYNFGSIGNGSLSHLAMEAIAQKSGTQAGARPLRLARRGDDRADARRRADGGCCRRSR